MREWLAERGIFVDQSTISTWSPHAGSLSGLLPPAGRHSDGLLPDKARAYPPALAALLPGVLHRTGRYRTNGIERDHGVLKERLRPMRGLKSVRSAAVFVVGHALVRNIRRGFYRIAEAPKRLMLAWSWSRLAEAV